MSDLKQTNNPKPMSTSQASDFADPTFSIPLDPETTRIERGVWNMSPEQIFP